MSGDTTVVVVEGDDDPIDEPAEVEAVAEEVADEVAEEVAEEVAAQDAGETIGDAAALLSLIRSEVTPILDRIAALEGRTAQAEEAADVAIDISLAAAAEAAEANEEPEPEPAAVEDTAPKSTTPWWWRGRKDRG